MHNHINHPLSVAVLGLGYVGLPLALSFGKLRPVLGFDINETRVVQLKAGIDVNGETSSNEFKRAELLSFSSDPTLLSNCNFFIVTVPTPVTTDKKPDLDNLIGAVSLVAEKMAAGSIVVIESTVYPGVTEEICAPIIEQISGLKFNIDFFCGYSPERINPGDKVNTLENIVKVTSGSNEKIAEVVDGVYREIITAGTFKAASIKVAEAAKVIENTQRDLNIALMNELSKIFAKLDLNTKDVLAAANTKWNFLPFTPGLVGGHCIGVDPYYLTHLAEQIGVTPEVIQAGRKTNDTMSTYVVDKLVSLIETKGLDLPKISALVLGLTFKENCSDCRNSQVVNIISLLETKGVRVEVFDPVAESTGLAEDIQLNLLKEFPEGKFYDAVILAVPHREFIQMGVDKLLNNNSKNALFFDLKDALNSPRSIFSL